MSHVTEIRYVGYAMPDSDAECGLFAETGSLCLGGLQTTPHLEPRAGLFQPAGV